MKKNIIYILTAILYIVAIFIVNNVTTYAADYTVSMQEDLQTAINSAADGSVIEISQDIILPTTINISKSLKFTGNNITLTVDGDFRHFNITGSDLTISFENIEILGRKTTPDDTLNPGGGISSSVANLTLEGAIVKDCYHIKNGGGFYTTGVTNITNCSFIGNSVDPNQDPTKSGIQAGGGIYTTKEIMLNNTTVSGNRAFDGGGIAANGNDAHVSLIGCTISGNISNGTGGTWPNYRGGAGVWTNGTRASVYVEDTDISSNISQGCGGGIMTCSSEAHITLSGSTVSENTAQKGGGAFAFQATANIISTDTVFYKNVTSVGSGGAIVNFLNGVGEGTITVNGGILSENDAESSGGAIYGKTIALTDATITKNTSKTSNGGAIYHTGKLNINNCAIQDNAANLYGGGIYGVTSSELYIVECTISGNTSGMSGGGIYAGTATTIDKTIITLNSSANHGPGVCATGTLTVQNNTLISKNTVIGPTSGQGGGIWGSTINVSNSTISDNTSFGVGGGIACSVILNVTDSKITGNITTKDTGGGIGGNGKVILTNTEVSGNTTSSQGGGIRSGDITINGGKISNNNSAGGGGGVYCTSGGKITINGSTITQNNAGTGGGIYAFTNSSVDIKNNTTISKNTVTGNGGGILSVGSSVNISDSAINENTAVSSGGGVNHTSIFTVTNSTINGNIARDGGGFWANAGSTTTIIDSDIDGNKATNAGGGFCSNAPITMTGGNLSNNTADSIGGGIYGSTVACNININGTTIANNTANIAGGIRANASGTTDITDATIHANTAKTGDGGGIQAYNSGATTITDTTISNNTSTAGSGGGIHALGANTKISIKGNTQFFQNSTPNGNGGAILIPDLNNLTVEENAVFNNNSAVKPYAWTLDPTANSYYTRLHLQNIKASSFTAPFTNLYNNYDANFSAYNIIYKSNGSGEEDISIAYQKDEVATIIPNPFHFTGKAFAFWNTQVDATGITYNPGDTTKMQVEDIVLYAAWETLYSVRFDAGGGTPIPPTQVVYSGSTIYAPTSPVLLGNGFRGWYKDETFAELWDFDNDVVTADITLYAGWDKDMYTVTFDSSGGSFVESVSVPYGDFAPIPAVPKLEGNKFAGWYKDDAFNEPWNFAYDTVTRDTTLYAKWIIIEKPAYKLTYKPNGAVGSDIVTAYGENTTAVILPNPFINNGYSFVEWNTSETGDGIAYTIGLDVLMDNNLSLYAQWRYNGGSGSATSNLTIECVNEDGKTIYSHATIETVGANKNVAAPIITGYVLNDETEKTIIIQAGTNALTFSYKKILLPPLIEKSEHIRYIYGYPDGSVNPDGAIIRSEAGVLFYRLIDDEKKNQFLKSKFLDVNENAWYAKEIAYLAAHGIINGYGDGTFKPGQPITRAEFTTIASRFEDYKETNVSAFESLPVGYWASSPINFAYAMNWVKGYEDGTFMEDNHITRAEAVKIINAMIDRKVQLEDIPSDIINYTDLKSSHWAYSDIIEASVQHEYTRKESGYELWH